MPTGVYPRKPRPLLDPLARFAAFIDPPNARGCWLWNGAKGRHGYGMFWVAGRTVAAHRYLYERTYGSLPRDVVVCHHCDTPACVRPAHLFAGTQRENIRDAIEKRRFDPTRIQRAPRACGETHGRHKLTVAQVHEIRQAWQANPRPSQRVLAAQYGVSKYAIYNVLQKGWRHL